MFFILIGTGSLSAQDAAFIELERNETEQSHFIDRHIDGFGQRFAREAATEGALSAIAQGKTQIILSSSSQLPTNRSIQKWTASSLPSFGPLSERRLDPLDALKSDDLTMRTDKFKSPVEMFPHAANFSGNDKKDPPKTDDDDPLAKPPVENRFHWKPAIRQSLIMLGVQHAFALTTQEKTRRAVANGNFFGDYWRSIRAIRGWDDGNRVTTNYIAHPMQGGLTGFIFVQNHDRAKKQKFAESGEYWNDRFKALIWSTAWSTQFELGPISQSLIGNVGIYGGMGYVDLVITPTVGTVWLISEEAIDRYIIRHIETRSFMLKVLARMFLNPMRGVANMLRFKLPWYRDRPFGH